LGFVQIFYYGVQHWGKIKVTLEQKGFWLSSGICVILTAIGEAAISLMFEVWNKSHTIFPLGSKLKMEIKTLLN
jgi:hypothetical protein